MDNERVEAAAKAITNEIGKLRDEGLQWNDDVPAIAAAALTAAEKVQGERVVLYNGPAAGFGVVVADWMRRTFMETGPRQITIEARGEELVVRKRRGT